MMRLYGAVDWLQFRASPDDLRFQIAPPVPGRDEYTLVAQARYTGALRDLLILSNRLGQDCIAVFDVSEGKGYLIGKNALDWGVFEPDLFINP